VTDDSTIALSVVVATHGRPELLERQLSALARQSTRARWEVVVADNGGSVATRRVVEAFADRVDLSLVDATERRGVCFARNFGVRHARGLNVAFLDDDDVVGEGWVDAMLAALRDHDVVAARLDFERLNPPWIVAFRGRPQQAALWTWYRTPELPVAFAGSLALRRTVHEKLGGFDEGLPTHEDADYCLRLRQSGYEIFLARDAVLHVQHRTTLGGTFRQALFYGDALPAFYRKHEPLGLRRPPRDAAIRGWLSVGRRGVVIHDRATLGAFVWQLGWRLGLIRGSIRHRHRLLSE
jgi:GT2 family glycosyltransferase